eukprot:scaffold64137_cov14-Tisochrysis_lutea.AAC.1
MRAVIVFTVLQGKGGNFKCMNWWELPLCTEELTRLHPWASRSTKFLMKPNGPMHAFASLDHDMS